MYSIPIGKKYKEIKVPDIIKLDKDYIKYFIKGVFDSDGNRYKHRGNECIQIRQKSYKFIKDLRFILNMVEIKFNEPYYDKANGSWLLWSSKMDLVNKFINDIININPFVGL